MANLKTWSYGEVPLASADLNGNFQGVQMVVPTFTYAGPTTTTNTSYVDATTFTLTGSGILLGFNLVCDISNTNSSHQSVIGVSFSGTSLGTKYLSVAGLYSNGTNSNNTLSTFIIGSSADPIVSTTSQTMAANGFLNLVLPDATTTITVKVRTSNAANTAGVSSLTLKPCYVTSYRTV